jgi:hypothetical protein
VTAALSSRLPVGAAADGALVVAGLVTLAFTERNLSGDGAPRYAATFALASGELIHERYPLVMPLLAVPFEWVDRLVDAHSAVTARFNNVVFALGVLAVWLLLRRRVPSQTVRAFALLLVFGSMFPAHVRSFYGETLTAVFVGVGLLAALVGERRATRAAGWAAALVGAVNTPPVIPGFALAVGLYALRTRRWAIVLLVPAAVVLAVADLRLRTGGFSSPYAGDVGPETVLPFSGRPGFSYPILLGVLAILFSFGKGLLFFAPGLFLPAGRRLAAFAAVRRTWILLLLVLAGMVAVYSHWWAWYGGLYWGPRFFLLASIPAALAIAVRLRPGERSLLAAAVTLLALLVSVWISISSAWGLVGQDVCVPDDYRLEFLCWYAPEFSPPLHQLYFLPPLATAQVVFALLAAVAFVRLAFPFVRDLTPLALERVGTLRRRLDEERW